MHLVFIRHAIAVDRNDPDVSNDAERWLTEKGIKRMKQAAKGFVKYVPNLDAIYTSTYQRALHTAEIVAEAYDEKPSIHKSDLLCPGCHIDELQKIVNSQSSLDWVALVGHEPDFSEMISSLLYGNLQADIEMKKGAICGIQVGYDIKPGRGILIFHLPPKVLRLLGES